MDCPYIHVSLEIYRYVQKCSLDMFVSNISLSVSFLDIFYLSVLKNWINHGRFLNCKSIVTEQNIIFVPANMCVNYKCNGML